MTNNKKLLASDYDWTFFRRDDKDLKNNLTAVNRWREQGNIFVFSTGRDVASMKYEKKEKNLDYDYMITLNGSLIVDKENNVLFKKSIDNKIACELIELMRKEIGNELIVSNGFDGCNLERIGQIKTSERARQNVERNSKIYTKTIETALQDEVLLVGCLSDSLEKALKFKDRILEDYSDKVDVFINLLYINIVPKGISKASGLDFLAEYTNINKNKVFVIGDDLNDIPMIKNYNGFAVENGRPEAKEVASAVYNSVSDLINDKI